MSAFTDLSICRSPRGWMSSEFITGSGEGDAGTHVGLMTKNRDRGSQQHALDAKILLRLLICRLLICSSRFRNRRTRS
jgi:hypothetical protein